jgi:anti-sigma factor RsiW
MTPERARVLLHAYLDGELDAASTVDLESEINRVPALRDELTRLRALQSRVREVGYFEAPSGLKERVFASRSHESPEPSFSVKESSSKDRAYWRGWAIGSSAIAAALLVWTVGMTFFYPRGNSRPAEEVVSAHVRSLMADHLTDLASAERHTVKPWLSNRLDFAPPVPDLSSQGYSLLGGRLDYLHGKAAAAVVYQHRQHIINVFVSPSLDETISAKPQAERERGYNTVRFHSRGMNYWLVSDVNLVDLHKLAELLQSAH